MRGEHANGKGPVNRLSGKDYKAYDNSVLWDNIDKKKLEKAKKEGRIKMIFIDERDDIPQEVSEQIVMKRGKANE